MEISSTVFEYWRNSLQHILRLFEDLRDRNRNFYWKIFAVFVVLNLGCYWWALLTAYPGNVFGRKAHEYVLMGFPVALLGAVFIVVLGNGLNLLGVSFYSALMIKGVVIIGFVALDGLARRQQ